MQFFRIFLLLAFVSAAAFGFTVIMSGPAHCLVSLMKGGVCPEGLFGFVSFHLGFFRNISSAIFDNLGILALFLVIGFISFASAGLKKLFLVVPSFAGSPGGGNAASPSERKTRKWLSLLETSPTSIPAR